MPSTTAQPTRPTMPESYGISRKTEGLLSWDWVEEHMTKANNYWVSSVRPDGRPHAMPISGLWVNGFLYFSSDRKARRARNLVANPHASIHLESADEVVIMEGLIEDVKDQAELNTIAHALGAKFNSEFVTQLTLDPANVLFKLTPQVVFAWTEKDYPNTATRWVFEK
jgi:general stress protein 26